MLLSAHADGGDFLGGSLGLLQGVVDGVAGGVPPSVGMLFLGAGRQASDQAISPRPFPDHSAIAGVDNQHFGGLRAAIDA